MPRAVHKLKPLSHMINSSGLHLHHYHSTFLKSGPSLDQIEITFDEGRYSRKSGKFYQTTCFDTIGVP